MGGAGQRAQRVTDRVGHLPEAHDAAQPAHPDHVMRICHQLIHDPVRDVLGIQHVVLHADESAGLLHDRDDLDRVPTGGPLAERDRHGALLGKRDLMLRLGLVVTGLDVLVELLLRVEHLVHRAVGTAIIADQRPEPQQFESWHVPVHLEPPLHVCI
jgi:hypothetical protein